MDPQIAKTIDASMPRMNEDMCNGLAVRHLEDVEKYIDDVLHCAAGGFPDRLEYVGSERCTPVEQFEELTRYRNDKFVFELARTDTYMVKYYFKWDGKLLPPKKINLPYVGDGGLMHINGVVHAVSPVLADPLFSISPGSIFVPLTRAKLTFERIHWPFFAGRERTGAYVVWSHVHNNSAGSKNTKMKPSVPAYPTMIGYLLCKHGLTGTLAKFGVQEYKVGYSDHVNETNYPPEKWVICKTATNLRQGNKLKPWIREKIARDGVVSVEPSKIHLAIPKKDFETNTSLASMVAGLFYVVDHFPDRVQPAYCDNLGLWQTLMGHINYPAHIGEGKMVSRVQSHLDSLDEYVDSLVREALGDEGIYADNIYDLFVVINNMLSSQVTDLANTRAKLHGKKFFVLKYLTSGIVRSIFELLFRLLRNKKELNENDVTDIIQKSILTDVINQVYKQHGEVNIMSYPGDNKALKVTSAIVPQAQATGTSRNKSTKLDASYNLDADVAEVCSLLNLPKPRPDGRSRVNIFVNTSPTGMVLENPELKDTREEFQSYIAR